jgi:hypothetical protein
MNCFFTGNTIKCKNNELEMVASPEIKNCSLSNRKSRDRITFFAKWFTNGSCVASCKCDKALENINNCVAKQALLGNRLKNL